MARDGIRDRVRTWAPSLRVKIKMKIDVARRCEASARQTGGARGPFGEAQGKLGYGGPSNVWLRYFFGCDFIFEIVWIEAVEGAVVGFGVRVH
jgi:hypothetical protein